MTIEIGILIAIIGVGISVSTFYIGRQTSAKTFGQEWGEMKSDIKHIKDDLSEIRIATSSTVKELGEKIENERKERREADQRLWNKYEEHVREHHRNGVV